MDEATQKDTSYVLRIPNSGGALIDGKPIGDAIRANPHKWATADRARDLAPDETAP